MTIAIQGKNNRGRNNAKALQTEEQVAAAVEAAKQLGGERQEVQVEETSSVPEVSIVEAPVQVEDNSPPVEEVETPEEAPAETTPVEEVETELEDILDIFIDEMASGFEPSEQDQLKLVAILEHMGAENLHPYVQMKLWDLGQKAQPWLCTVDENKEWAPLHEEIKESLLYRDCDESDESEEPTTVEVTAIKDMVGTLLPILLTETLKGAVPGMTDEKISAIVEKAQKALVA